jgi:hypothetical protein
VPSPVRVLIATIRSQKTTGGGAMQCTQLGSTLKTVVLLIASLGVGMTTASADPLLPAYLTKRSGQANPESITSDEALWAAFQNISILEAKAPGLGANHLERIGLSALDSLALAKHIEASIAAADTYSRELAESLCANREAIQSSQALYVEALKDMDSKMEALHATLIAKVSDIISAEGKEKFYAWTRTEILPGLTLISTDHAMRVAMLNVDPAAEIERLYAALRQPTSPTRVQTEVKSGVTITRFTR